jgi:hypothetical protein
MNNTRTAMHTLKEQLAQTLAESQKVTATLAMATIDLHRVERRIKDMSVEVDRRVRRFVDVRNPG